jgi:hypothetical protein
LVRATVGIAKKTDGPKRFLIRVGNSSWGMASWNIRRNIRPLATTTAHQKMSYELFFNNVVIACDHDSGLVLISAD